LAIIELRAFSIVISKLLSVPGWFRGTSKVTGHN
jgi:hypothetical protein